MFASSMSAIVCGGVGLGFGYGLYTIVSGVSGYEEWYRCGWQRFCGVLIGLKLWGSFGKGMY